MFYLRRRILNMTVVFDDLMDEVLAEIDEDEVLAFARGLGEIPSQCGYDPESEAAAFMVTKMKEAGLETELDEVQPGRPNVYGYLRGSGEGPTLMLNGHIDTMPFSMTWPYGHESAVEDGYLRVHGIRNMKAGVAAMTMAAIALARVGVKPKGDLIVAGVIGHHEGSVGTLHLIRNRKMVPDYAIVPEPTDLGVRTIQTGNVGFKLHIVGQSGATGNRQLYDKYSDEKYYPVDAVQQAYRVIEALEDVQWSFTPYEPMPDLPMHQIRGIHGGYGPHLLPGAFVPDYCVVTVGVLTVPGQTPKSVEIDVERTLDALRHDNPDLNVELELTTGSEWQRKPLQVDPEAYIAQTVFSEHKAVTGKEPKLGAIVPNSYFGCDAQPLWLAGCQAISYGPAGHAYIPENRGRVRIEDLITCTRVIALSALKVALTTHDGVGMAP
jgi:acetylornithine deacetylase/succinyl-diaminopimelate desuccinylase-like protein